MIRDTLEGFRDYLVSAVSHLDFVNVTIDDASVFNEILVIDPPVMHCVIISFGGADEANQPSDFGSFLMSWGVVVNLFHLLQGDDSERAEQIMTAYGYVDDIMNAVKDNPTLNGVVTDAKLTGSTPPLSYSRSDIGNYFMLGIKFDVIENM